MPPKSTEANSTMGESRLNLTQKKSIDKNNNFITPNWLRTACGSDSVANSIAKTSVTIQDD